MANSLIVAGGLVRLYVNNKVYSVTQSVSINQTTGEYEIFGINSPYPQELAGGGQISVKGSAKGVRVKQSGGLQGANLRPLFSDVAASSYVSLRLEDRSTGETIWSVPKAKVSNINESVATKGIYQVSFDFIGQILFWPLDLS
jgi:hypothetical protein